MSTPTSRPPGEKAANRLARESSPYLLQHRFNPVDWFAWGPEAFAEARRRDVPIFLSVGYSTCYWCHVMERECFENEAIAAQMNASFVCIKVDREERPDVDDIYMAAVQAFTQRGGWPMSVFLEPTHLRPFWAGTYFPPEPKFGGMPSFPQILDGIARAWTEQRVEVEGQAEQLADAVRERVATREAPSRVSEEQVTRATAQLLRLHDPIRGGFGGAPKFPQPAFLDLLLTVRSAAADDDTRRAIDAALRTTLSRMALGGIFDQIGGGFHRYSVDENWIVPHFEKMLYDNGALAETYARAFTALGDPLFARAARRICEYTLREMAAPEGGGGAFWSAQDAEVDHREGKNYLWTRAQMDEALGAEDGAWASHIYGLDAGTNFRDPHHPSEPTSNVLFVSAGEAADWNPGSAFAHRLDAINARLLAARARRKPPSTDTKIIAAWNGLMIAGLATTGAALKEPEFIAAARKAADFVLASMRSPDGALFRTFGAGRPSIPAFLEDHAMLAHGLIELHLAGGGGANSAGKYLIAARDLMARAESGFADASGGYADAPASSAELFVRPRSTHDGAMSSGVSVMINNLVDLALITGDATYRTRAAQAIASISGSLAAHPLGASGATRGLLRLLSIDRQALDRALASADAKTPGTPAPAEDDESPSVEILSAVDSVQLPPDQPVGIVLRVRMAPGLHLTAADPGEGFVGLSPFRVHIIGGTGVAVYADYPPGEPLGPDGYRVYRAEFDLPVVLESFGEFKGTPLIAVTFQPCTDTECLAARTVELDVSIEPP